MCTENGNYRLRNKLANCRRSVSNRLIRFVKSAWFRLSALWACCNARTSSSDSSNRCNNRAFSFKFCSVNACRRSRSESLSTVIWCNKSARWSLSQLRFCSNRRFWLSADLMAPFRSAELARKSRLEDALADRRWADNANWSRVSFNSERA